MSRLQSFALLLRGCCDGSLHDHVDVLGEEGDAGVRDGVVCEALQLAGMVDGDVAGLVGVEAEEVVALGARGVDLDVVLHGGVNRAGGDGAGGHERAEARPVLDVGDAEGGEDLGVGDLLREVDGVHEVDDVNVAEGVVLDEVVERGPRVRGGGDEVLAGDGGGAFAGEHVDEVLLDAALDVGNHRGVGRVDGGLVAALLDFLQGGLLAVGLDRDLVGRHVGPGVLGLRDLLPLDVLGLGELAGDFLLVQRLADVRLDGVAGGEHLRELGDGLGEGVDEVDVACCCEGLDVGHSGPFLPLLEEVDVGRDGGHAFFLVLDSEDVLLGGLAWLLLLAGLGHARRAALRLRDGRDRLGLLGERLLVGAAQGRDDRAVEPGRLRHGIDELRARRRRLEVAVLLLERGDALFDGRVGLPLGLLQGVELLEVVLRALLPFAGLLDGVLVEGLVVLAPGAALGLLRVGRRLLRVCLRLLSCRVLACVLHAFLLSGAVRRLVSPRAGHFHV
nr:MAG TPA_asm: hypothetical protein [Caudoviricetes sp.]